MRMVTNTTLRPIAAIIAVVLLLTSANYYLELGWFGRYGRIVLSVALLATVLVLAFAFRNSREKQ